MPGQHAVLAQEISLFWYGGMLIKVLPHHLLALGYSQRNPSFDHDNSRVSLPTRTLLRLELLYLTPYACHCMILVELSLALLPLAWPDVQLVPTVW